MRPSPHVASLGPEVPSNDREKMAAKIGRGSATKLLVIALDCVMGSGHLEFNFYLINVDVARTHHLHPKSCRKLYSVREPIQASNHSLRFESTVFLSRRAGH